MTLVDHMGMDLLENGDFSQFLFEEVSDLDLSSLYPSIIIALNLSPETFICKMYIQTYDEAELVYKNVEDIFVDEYIAKDYIFLGTKYAGLPSLDDMVSGF